MKSRADSVHGEVQGRSLPADRIRHRRSIPMYLCHGIALGGPFLVRFSWNYVALATVLYAVRMIALSAGYHRYFAHRTYRNQPCLSVRAGVRGWYLHAAGRAVVGGQQPAPSRPFGSGRGRSLSGAPWFLLEPPGLDPVEALRAHAARAHPGLRLVPRAALAGPPSLRALLGAVLEPVGAGRVAGRDLGLFHVDRLHVALHVQHQLAGTPVWPAALRDRGRFAEQPAAGVADHGRGLAQQPPPLPRLRRAGVLLVGDL